MAKKEKTTFNGTLPPAFETWASRFYFALGPTCSQKELFSWKQKEEFHPKKVYWLPLMIISYWKAKVKGFSPILNPLFLLYFISFLLLLPLPVLRRLIKLPENLSVNTRCFETAVSLLHAHVCQPFWGKTTHYAQTKWQEERPWNDVRPLHSTFNVRELSLASSAKSHREYKSPWRMRGKTLKVHNSHCLICVCFKGKYHRDKSYFNKSIIIIYKWH